MHQLSRAALRGLLLVDLTSLGLKQCCQLVSALPHEKTVRAVLGHSAC